MSRTSQAAFSYMEFEWATGTRWHIRRLSERGKFFEGGADTPSLCGVKHRGWDVKHAPPQRGPRPDFACVACWERFMKPAAPAELSLADIQAGAQRASERFMEWPAWKRAVSEPAPTDTHLTTFPVCPHCGSDDQDWWDGLTIQVNDGTKWTAHCSDCGGDYEVSACVDVTFTTKALDAEAEKE